jgi:sigma-B regulation protein RsbU (phosphoserine phosphatase)
MPKPNPIKRIFELYTSDLSFSEIERLIRRDASDVYEFYSQNIPKPDTSKNKFFRALIFTRSLFNAFLMKFSAARRFIYLITLIIFFIGFLELAWGYVFTAFLVMNILLAFELADKLIVKDDLNLARKIQQDLMPKNIHPLKNYECSSFYESAKEVGGDYYEIIPSENKSFIVIGDISGKGLAAALYMVRVQAIIHTLVRDLNSPKEILLKLKQTFSKNLSKGYFLTIITSSIEENGIVKLCSAGHTPVYWYKNNEDHLEEVNPKGIGIGLNDKGVFEKTLDEIRIRMNADDILLFFTDGLPETMNIYKRQFGFEHIKKILKDNSNLPVDLLKDKIVSEVNYFKGDALQQDDLTMIVLKYNLQ